jgi:SSS family solute:Na+ symporter
VRIHPAWLRYVALSPDAKDMAENLYRALWSLLICIFVTIVVSLFTEPKPKEQLEGLVWSYTKFPKGEAMAPWQKPIFWAGGVAILFGILQWAFW